MSDQHGLLEKSPQSPVWSGARRVCCPLILPISSMFLAVACILMPSLNAKGQAVDHALTASDVAPVMDWSHVLQAHAVAEDWVAAGSISQAPARSPLEVTGVGGVRVTIRWSGLTVGVGDAYAKPPLTRSDAAIDLCDLVAAATERALQGVDERLRDHRLRQRLRNDSSADLEANRLTTVGDRLQIDLQVARTTEPIVLSTSAKAQSIEHQFVPGYHGLRMVRQSAEHRKRSSWIWPGTALAANISSRNQLRRLLADLDYGLNQLPAIGRANGPQLQRFEIIHVVRAGPQLPVVRLEQGCQNVSLSSISAGFLEEMAGRLTDFLIRRQRSDGRMAGTYHPSLDRYDPLIASDQQLALALYALGSRATALTRLSSRRSDKATAVQRAVDRMTEQLLRKPTDHPSSFDAKVASWLLMALTDVTHLARHKNVRERLARQLLARRRSDGIFRATPDVESPRLSYQSQAMIVAALSNLYERTRDQQLAAQLVESLDKLWQSANAEAVLEMSPWMAMAEIRMRRWRVVDVPQDQFASRDQRLNQLAEDLHRLYVVGSQRSVSSGMVEVTFRDSDTLEQPTWRAADLILVQTSMMQKTKLLLGHDSVQRLLSCSTAARSLAQLMFDDAAAYYVRSRSDTLGGVKRSLSDNRLEIEPAAMSLLAITQLQQTAAFLADEND